MMGASDAEEKKNLKDALTAVWSVWTEGIDVKEGTTIHQFSMGDSADSEDEGEKGGGGEGRFVARSKIEGETSLMKDIFDIEEDKQGIVRLQSMTDLLVSNLFACIPQFQLMTVMSGLFLLKKENN